MNDSTKLDEKHASEAAVQRFVIGPLTEWIRLQMEGIRRSSPTDATIGAERAFAQTLKKVRDIDQNVVTTIDTTDRLVSELHDLIYVDRFNQQAASDKIWEIHHLLRGEVR